MKTVRSYFSSLPLGWLSALFAGGLMLRLLLTLPGSEGLALGHRTLIRHVSLYEPETGVLLRDRDLSWKDGRILCVAPGGSLDPSGSLVLDGQGLCALPALADAAVFLSLAGRYPGDSVAADAGQSLRAQAAVGMGAVLDLNANRDFIQGARALSGGLPSAHFAGALFSSPGGWGLPGQAPWDGNRVDVQDMADLLAPWNRAVRFHDQALFVAVDSDGHDGLAIPLPVLLRLGALAHGQGLPLIVATHRAHGAELALQAGPDAVLGPLFDLDGAPRLAEEMRSAHCAYIPALGSVLNAFPPEPLAAWLPRFQACAGVGVSVLAQVKDPQNLALWAGTWTRQNADPAKILGAVKSLDEGGVTLAFGSGSGLPLVLQGLGAQMEMALLARAGLKPRTLLAAATVNSHTLIGVEGGTLGPGAPADVLLVAGLPDEDASLAVRPQRVFLGGIEVKP